MTKEQPQSWKRTDTQGPAGLTVEYIRVLGLSFRGLGVELLELGLGLSLQGSGFEPLGAQGASSRERASRTSATGDVDAGSDGQRRREGLGLFFVFFRRRGVCAEFGVWLIANWPEPLSEATDAHIRHTRTHARTHARTHTHTHTHNYNE